MCLRIRIYIAAYYLDVLVTVLSANARTMISVMHHAKA